MTATVDHFLDVLTDVDIIADELGEHPDLFTPFDRDALWKAAQRTGWKLYGLAERILEVERAAIRAGTHRKPYEPPDNTPDDDPPPPPDDPPPPPPTERSGR